MVQELTRCTGEISSTAQTRINRTCRSRLICAASSKTCATTTAASSVKDLCREGIAIIEKMPALRNLPSIPADRDATGARPERGQWIHPAAGTAKCQKSRCAPRLIDRHQPQEPEIAKHLARAEHDRCQWIIRDRNRQTGFLTDALVEVLEQRAAASENNTPVADVGRKLWWRALERDAAGVQYGRDAFGKRFADFAVINRDGPRHALDQIAALDFHGERLLQRIRRPNFHLDLLGGALANQQIVFALQIVHDRFVHFIARNAH